jgi:hypothetical protein
LIDPEPAPNAKKVRIVSQQEIVEDIDNAPDLTDSLAKKMVHMRAEQASRIQSNLESIKGWKSIGLKLDPEMREMEATIIKIDNKDEVPKIPPHKDPKRLAHFSIHSPYENRATQILGESRVQTGCYGCHHGLGLPDTNSKVTTAFEQFAVDLFMNIDWILAAKQCAKYYKKFVMPTVDPLDPDGPLPRWEKRDIFDHFKDHTPHEALQLRWKRMQMREIMNVLYENSIFTCNPEIMKLAHRAPENKDIEIDREAVGLWLKLMTLETKLGQSDPKKFVHKNDRIDDTRVAPAMTKKISKGRQLKLPSLFNPECG